MEVKSRLGRADRRSVAGGSLLIERVGMFKKDDIRNFIVETFLFGDGEWLRDDTSFLDGGVIDSAGMLELITFVESKYGVAVADDEVVRENFDSLENVSRFLARKLSSAS